jgi:2-C-methyl-D-erythritol 2,4-cyclodiphosphate synthase
VGCNLLHHFSHAEAEDGAINHIQLTMNFEEIQWPGAVIPKPYRIGHGYDIHRLQSGGQLVLCGVVVADNIGPIAHSDGDVAVHAIVDAILGAMSWGDIGEWFSNSDERWRNISSLHFLETVTNKIRLFDYSVSNLDVTILAERPKLKMFKREMTAKLHQVLGGEINIKAGTNEACDAIGRGEAIACHAVVLLEGDF